MIKLALGILALAVIYCFVGVLIATYKQIQTDDPFDWKIIFNWLPMYIKSRKNR